MVPPARMYRVTHEEDPRITNAQCAGEEGPSEVAPLSSQRSNSQRSIRTERKSNVTEALQCKAHHLSDRANLHCCCSTL